MTDTIANDRSYAAALARRYFYERSVTGETIFQTFAATTDPLIAELLDLVAYEPRRDGMLGVRYDEYVKRYWPHVAAVLQQLERGASGKLPARGRFSAIKLILSFAIMLYFAAAAAENLVKIIQHVRGVLPLGPWPLLGHILGTVIMSGLTLRMILAVLTAVQLYRRQRERRAG